MRYDACTEANVKLLCSCIVGRGSDMPSLTDLKFHNVSIITSWNAHRDKINEVHSQHFAEKTDQTLVEFYSRDKQKADSKEHKKGN